MLEEKKITIIKNGPYVVTGNVPLSTEMIVCDEDNIPVRWESGQAFPEKPAYSLCRCGQSANKPFCDGTHQQIGFTDAVPPRQRRYFEDADEIEGPGITIHDDRSLCATGEFCHRAGNIWRLASTAEDSESIEIVISNACDCPSGRLVAVDPASGTLIEPKLEPAISLIEIPALKLSGPIWVKGGLPIESIDGWQYEIRNRVTLCRCGQSKNMPFCNGTHLKVGFKDGSEEIG